MFAMQSSRGCIRRRTFTAGLYLLSTCWVNAARLLAISVENAFNKKKLRSKALYNKKNVHNKMHQ